MPISSHLQWTRLTLTPVTTKGGSCRLLKDDGDYNRKDALTQRKKLWLPMGGGKGRGNMGEGEGRHKLPFLRLQGCCVQHGE